MKYTDEKFFEFDSSTGTITGYSKDAAAPKDVAIPPTILGVDVNAIGEWAFDNNTFITSITIPDGVTSIGAGAFFGCSELEGSLMLPKKLTFIGYGAFHGCSGLAGPLTIPNSVTSIGDAAFYDCSGLTNLTISSGVKQIGSCAFCGCYNLTGPLTIPDGVTSIGHGAFDGCSGLAGPLTIPNSVTSIGRGAFRGCSGITIVTVPEDVTTEFQYMTKEQPQEMTDLMQDDFMIDIGSAPYGTDIADMLAIQYNYHLLSRMKSDCEYFIGTGNGHRKDLWARNIADQIKTMRELYEKVPEKPEWLPEDKIGEYEDQMLMVTRIRAAQAAGYGNVRELEECIATGGEKHEQCLVDYSLLSAVSNNQFEMVDWLLENGANPLMVSDYSLDRAEENGNFEAVQRVRDQRARQEALYATGSTYEIWQLKDNAEERSLLFLSYQAVQKQGAVVDPHNYDRRYIGPLKKDTTLEDIFSRFNTDKPGDFKGHSLSVSDVVVLKKDGRSSAWYVDPVGFKEVPEFLGKEPLVQKEMPMSQNMER